MLRWEAPKEKERLTLDAPNSRQETAKKLVPDRRQTRRCKCGMGTSEMSVGQIFLVH
jgi:hypothetical protein